MKQKKNKFYAILLVGLGLTSLQAQETNPASGGNASGNGGSVSYSVGQIVYTTNTGTNGSMAQGVQQPFEISVVTEIEEAKGISLHYSAYPNPTTDILILKTNASSMLNIQLISYQLLDINGKLLETKKVDGNETSIVMSNLAPAIYFLKVTESNKAIKTFKIIKN